MPLITAAYFALCAGLIAGFGGHALSAAVACAACLLAATWRKNARWLALSLVALAGVLVAERARRIEGGCHAALARAREYRVTVYDTVAPGRLVRGRAEGACGTRVSLAVEQGEAAAGTRARVRGIPSASEGRVHVRRAHVVALSGNAATAARLRARAGREIDMLFGADSAIARALLIADASGLDSDVRDQYADAGLVHMLSVSGLHVAIVAQAIVLLLGAARVPHVAAHVASVLAVGGYVLFLGAPAPAVRAAVMLAALAISRVAQRPTSPWAAYALGGLVPLLDPRQVQDIGYQLSMAGMAAIVAAGTLTKRVLADPAAPKLVGWRRTVAVDLTASVVATLATAPTVAWHFGRLSLVAPFANLVAAPIVALLQPMLFLAIALAPLEPIARFVAGAARPLLRALDAVAAAAASLPGAAASVTPTTGAAVLAAGAAVACIVACASRAPARPALAAVACYALLAWLPHLAPPARGELELHMLDVGQGDAIAVRSPRGRWVLFDAGRVWQGGDAGRRTIVPYLRRRGGALAAFVLSHPHADHVGGAATVLRALRPKEFFDGAFTLGSQTYRGALLAARDVGARWRRVRPGERFELDGMVIEFLAPDSAWTASLDDPNLASVVASVRYRQVRFLLVGDAEAAEEQWLLSRARGDPAVAELLRADVLKVGHHGSATSSTPEFISAVRPRVALVSVGAGNSYRHPSADVIRRFRERGTEILRTDFAGAVVVRTDGRTLTLWQGSHSWPAPPARGDDVER